MTVTVQRDGRIAIVTIDRPDRRNAVDAATATALFEAFLAFETDSDADIAILSGAGGAFSAGYDLKSVAAGLPEGWLERHAIPDDWADPAAMPLPGPMGPTRLVLSKPVIAAVEGPAVAGGMELALWCDLRVMSETAYMGVFCRRFGVPLIDGGTVRLPRLIGQSRAMDLILTGRKVDAAEAMQIGLANRLSPGGQALDHALELARSLLAHPQACLRADGISARLSGRALADALRQEWRSIAALETEGLKGAARFADSRSASSRW